MIALNRREFLAVVGGASAVSVLGMRTPAIAETTTPLYIKGLMMVSFEDAQVLRIGFPKAMGHKATLSIQPVNGARRIVNIKGNGKLEFTTWSNSEPRIHVPELVRMKEFYGESIRSRIETCPSVLSIPYSAILSVTTHEVSKDRWTFVRSDNGEEVSTFRPRHVAESLKIELSSAAMLRLNNGTVNLSLDTAKELWAEYLPETPESARAADHFVHYFAYMERPAAADFQVVPKKLTGSTSNMPSVGNRFAMIDWLPPCWLVGI
jgi:hypothetical protein